MEAAGCRREETGILEVDREECCDQAADILSEMRGESFRCVFYVRESFFWLMRFLAFTPV
jgi:hypothetical protein